jgi:uncharacterized Zn finger protein
MIEIVARECPICGHRYTDHPALSRLDNVTLICPECGQRQALESIGVTDKAEQDHIIDVSKRARRMRS